MFKKISIILFTLISLFFILVCSTYYLKYQKYQYGIRDNKLNFENFVKYNLKPILDSIDASFVSIYSGVFERHTFLKESKIKSIYLEVENNAFEYMASNLPKSAKEKYYEGTLLYEDGLKKPIKLRFRGQNIWHWDPVKPSLRIKLKKKYPYKNLWKLNLVNPEDPLQIANLYGEKLAEKFNLLTNHTEMVRVFVNKKYYGVYQLTSDEGEGMLRNKKRIPGPLFIGSHLPPDWNYKSFEYKGDLDIIDDFNPIQNLVSIINSDNKEETHIGRSDLYKKLWSILDKKKFASWVALMNLTGSLHTDYSHNHTYFFDLRLGKIEPAINDILALGALNYKGGLKRLIHPYEPDYTLPLNEKRQPLLNIALKDPKFYDLRNKLLFDSLKTFGSSDEQNKLLRNMLELIEEDIKADKNKSYLAKHFVGFFRAPISYRGFNEQKKILQNYISKRNYFLEQELLNTEIFINHNMIGEETELKIGVMGHSSVILDGNLFPDGSYFLINKNKILIKRNEKYKLYPGLMELDSKHQLVRSNRDANDFSIVPAKQNYFLYVPSLEIDYDKLLKNSISNSLNNLPLLKERIYVDKKDNSKLNTLSYPLIEVIDKKINDIVIGPGKIVINKNLIGKENQRIIIKPGTHLLMDKNVSILSFGGIKIGSDNSNLLNVNISRLNNELPWGVIGTIGNYKNEIYNSHITGGSKVFLKNIYFSGMVTLTNSDDIKIKNSYFGDNISGDDTLHINYSNSTIENSTFSNCFGDCVDFDYSNVEAKNLSIYNSNNDGLDFMTSTGKLNNIIIKNVGDKGISVGEGSNLTALNLKLEKNYIGIAAKDQSTVIIDEISILNSDIGIDIYSKNLRYNGAGKVYLKKEKFVNNGIDIRLNGGLLQIDEDDKKTNLNIENNDGQIF